jgi:hypothetical protein
MRSHLKGNNIWGTIASDPWDGHEPIITPTQD